MSSRSLFSVLVVLAGISMVASQERYTVDLEVKYFTATSMLCDHPELNITRKTNVRSLTWVFPDTTTVGPNTYIDPYYFILSGPDADVPVAGDRSRLDGYNLTVKQVDIDVYGYYTCIVVYDTVDIPSVIRWGLNVDGADYSDLIESYKDGAIIGGVAAAVFFVLVVGSCIVWHCFFVDNNGSRSDDEDEKVLDETAKTKHKDHVYSNVGYNGDADSTEVEFSVEISNGVNTKM